jgi:hypothetical protein
MKTKKYPRVGEKIGKIRAVLGALPLCLGLTIGSAHAIDQPLEKFLSPDRTASYILKRVPLIIDDLRRAAGTNEKLKPLLERLRVRATEESDYELYPNAYAKPGKDIDLIVIEAPFLGVIGGQASVGALFATGWPNANDFFDLFCRDFKASYKQSSKEPSKEVKYYLFDLDKYLHAKKTYYRVLIDRLYAMVADDTLIWYFLHEAGHHALRHQPEVSSNDESRRKSRQKEEEADRWASSTMQELGYSLFGISHYLYGRAMSEKCLTELGLITPENQSTHPSYSSRFSNMKREFDITRAQGKCDLRVFMPFVSAAKEPKSIYLTVPSKTSKGYRVMIDNQSDNFLQGGVCEWNGNTINIYARTFLGRIEFVIPDGSRVHNKIVRREYGLLNQLLSNNVWRSYQLNASFEFLKVAGGFRLSDIAEDMKSHEWIAKHLRKVGTPEASVRKILQAIEEKETAEKDMVVAFHKGQIDWATSEARFAPVYEKYKRNWDMYVGKERYNLFLESIRNDPLWPLMQQSKPGSGTDHKQFEKKIFEKNFLE